MALGLQVWGPLALARSGDVWAYWVCEVQLLVQLYGFRPHIDLRAPGDRLFVRLCLSDPGYCQPESGDGCPRVMCPWACREVPGSSPLGGGSA